LDAVFQYDISVWHPLVVHFPIALILVGALALVVWSLRGTSFWRQCALWLLSLGWVVGIVAYQTGEVIEEHTEGTPIVEELVAFHEDAAFYALLVTGAVVLALAALSVWLERRITLERNPPEPLVARIVLALAALVAAALIAWTAHIGGTMVWGA
jgi:uncharacterized membrane protein